MVYDNLRADKTISLNRIFSEADFSKLKAAERSFVFYKKLNIRPLWTIEEVWDLKDERKLDPTATTIAKPINLPRNEENNENKLDRTINRNNPTNLPKRDVRR